MIVNNFSFSFLGAANSNDEIDNILMQKPAKPVKRTFSIPTSAKKPSESQNQASTGKIYIVAEIQNPSF